jgi:hypothetical protein
MKDGKSPAKLLSQLGKAAEGIYRARGFDENDEKLACLVLRIGGPRLLHALHVRMHLPCVSKMYASSMYKAFRVLVCPTANREVMIRFMHHGICTYVEVERKLKASGCVVGQPVQLMVDETAVNDVVSYCSSTNSMVGIARQGTADVDFKVQSVQDVNRVQLLLHSGELKRCTEGTVIAVAPFRNHHYRGLPVFVTGSVKSKREDDNLQEQFQLFGELWEHERGEGGSGHGILGPLIVIASDGDAARRQDFVEEFFVKDMSSVPQLAAALTSMPLLDLKVGLHGRVGSFDWKHIIKRFRGRLITKVMGMTISNDGILTKDLLQRLLQTGLGRSFASLFDPSDRQNVPLAVRLLRATVELGKVVNLPAGVMDVPSLSNAMADMRLLGAMSECLLSVLVDSEKSVSDLLKQLSKLSHILLVVYREHRTKFIPGQLYHDLQATVRAAFFVAAQLKLCDDVNAELFLWMLGSDRLEGIFRDVRTLNHSSNFSLNELGDKLGAAAHISALTADMPDIERRSRLQVGSDDHMNTVSWTGSTKIGVVNLSDCWLQGRLSAVEALNMHSKWTGIDVRKLVQLAADGCTALLPFGCDGDMPGVTVDFDANVEEDVDVDTPNERTVAQQPARQGAGVAIDEPEHGVEEDDEFAVEMVTASALSEAPAALGGDAVEMTMEMEGKSVFKASVVRIVCNEESSSGCRSTDRLKRVMGVTPFTTLLRRPEADVSEECNAEFGPLSAGDPFAALVRVPNSGVVLAVVVASRNYSPALGGLVHGTVVSLKHYIKGNACAPSTSVVASLRGNGDDEDVDDDGGDDDGGGGGGGNNNNNDDDDDDSGRNGAAGCGNVAAAFLDEDDDNNNDEDDGDDDDDNGDGNDAAATASDGGRGGDSGGEGTGGVARGVVGDMRLVWDGARGSSQNSRAVGFDRRRILPLDADEIMDGKAEWDEVTLAGIQRMLLQVTDLSNRAPMPSLTAAVEASLPLPYLPSLVAVPVLQAARQDGGVACHIEGCAKSIKLDAMRDHVAHHFAKGTLNIPATSWGWCGFCGRNSGCVTILRKGSNASTIIINSNCPMAPRGRKGAGSVANDCRISFKTAAKANGSSTSNVPLPCVLCVLEQDPGADISATASGKRGGLYVRLYDGKTFVWKFAMASHLNEAHPGKELPTEADWAGLYDVEEELNNLRGRPM